MKNTEQPINHAITSGAGVPNGTAGNTNDKLDPIILEKRISRSSDAVNVRDFANSGSAAPTLYRSNTDPLPARPAFVSHTTTKPPLFEKPVFGPAKALKKSPTFKACFINAVRYSPLNVLLVFIPVSWALNFAKVGDTAVFITSALAIIPCAALLSFATEELAVRVGDAAGGLLNATFGNAIELIVAILALVKGELAIVQAAMLGSIISNSLLVLGCCFFAGGLRFYDQPYSVRNTQLNISMLGLSVHAIVIPAAFHIAIGYYQDQNGGTAEENAAEDAQTQRNILSLSRGVAFILLFVYAAYLVFQLFTHSFYYKPEETADGEIVLARPQRDNVFRVPSWHGGSSRGSDDGEADEAASSTSSGSTDEDGVHQPKLKVSAALVLLLTVTALAGVTSEWLVSSINGLAESRGVSKIWISFILLPLIGNAAEHVAAVTVAVKGRLDLSIAIAVGSSIQISLFVLPVLILLGWAIGQPLSMFFDIFETLTLFISIVIVNWAIQDNATNWLEGLTLMATYLIIALSFWWYDGQGTLA